MKIVLKATAITVAVLLGVTALVLGGLVLAAHLLLPSAPGCDVWNGKADFELATSVIQADTGGRKVGDSSYDCDSSRQPRRIDLGYDVGRDQVEAMFSELRYCKVSVEPHTWECKPKGRVVEVLVYLDGVAVSLNP